MPLQNSPQSDISQDSDRPLHILLCPDQPSWAFDNIANNIARYAGHNRISKLYMADVIGNEHLFFEAIFLKRIDLCHVFWREDLFYLLHPQIIDKAGEHLGLDFETMVRGINSCAFTTSIYDHLFCSEDEIRQRRSNFAMIDGYTVSSGKLQAIYSCLPDIPPPDAIISDGVDLERFSPGPAKRAETKKAHIGWVGNSSWGKEKKGFDVKGYQRLFQPMMSVLESDGYGVEEKVADPQVKRVPHEEMPDFYRNLDVFVCTSAMEGTPNTILESMACGIPVVSTNVGIVPEACGDLQKRFVLTDPTVNELAEAVAALLKDKQLCKAIGAENRARVQDWSWQARTADWWPFWIRTVTRAMDHRTAVRREAWLLAQQANL